MDKIRKRMVCPKCGLKSDAEVARRRYKFLVYRCPECASNVVSFAGRVVTVSDGLVDSLLKSGRLMFCGDTVARPSSKVSAEKGEITADAVTNLKILLATESDFDKIVSQL